MLDVDREQFGVLLVDDGGPHGFARGVGLPDLDGVASCSPDDRLVDVDAVVATIEMCASCRA